MQLLIVSQYLKGPWNGSVPLKFTSHLMLLLLDSCVQWARGSASRKVRTFFSKIFILLEFITILITKRNYSSKRQYLGCLLIFWLWIYLYSSCTVLRIFSLLKFAVGYWSLCMIYTKNISNTCGKFQFSCKPIVKESIVMYYWFAVLLLCIIVTNSYSIYQYIIDMNSKILKLFTRVKIYNSKFIGKCLKRCIIHSHLNCESIPQWFILLHIHNQFTTILMVPCSWLQDTQRIQLWCMCLWQAAGHHTSCLRYSRYWPKDGYRTHHQEQY